MNRFIKDLQFGLLKEDETEKIISEYFKDELTKSKKYDKYDWKGKKYYYELKSRMCEYKKYDTTLIPASKIFTKYQRFIFNFTDGIYYIKYREHIFDTFEKKQFVRFARDGKKDIPQLYIHIPINKLKKIKLLDL